MTNSPVSEILDRVADAYTGCVSYRDSGECKHVIISGPRDTDRHTRVLEFETAYVRPDKFRFEYRDRGVGPRSEWTRCVVWQLGERVQSWGTLRNGIESFETLEMALAGPTGVSHGTAIFVPRLLMPYRSRDDLECQFGDTLNVGTEDINGLTCQKLEASKPKSREQRICVWIDVATHFVVRLDTEDIYDAEEERLLHEETLIELRTAAKDDEDAAKLLEMMEDDPPEHHNFKTEQSTLYRPEFNCEIDREVFEFEPPGDCE